MFQGSIKKITRRLVIVSMAVCAGLWFAGCGPREKEEEKKEEDPLKVTGGNLTEGGGGVNAPVTEANLNDFINVFLSALNSDYSESGNAPRGKRDKRLPEYDKGYEGWKGNYKIIGDSLGYVEITEEAGEGSDWTNTSAYYYIPESNTYKFFDFSNTNKLFLGGAFGYVLKDEVKNNIGNTTEKVNGAINFKGAYEGKVVFDNLSFVFKYTYKEILVEKEWGTWTESKIDTISYTKSGKFYVESGGNKINLPDSLVWAFIHPYSNKDRDYGDDKITLNTNVAVPAAPNGNLSERAGGEVVNASNVDEFFEAFREEFSQTTRASRALIEGTENWEYLEHGEVSGYRSYKWYSKSQFNNSGEYSVGTATTKYDDYSNKGRLYLGGGYGELVVGFSKYTNNPYSQTSKDTTTINGKVKFNGEFKGELDFQSFKYEGNYEAPVHGYEYKIISGKVMIGSYDATQKYFDEFIR